MNKPNLHHKNILCIFLKKYTERKPNISCKLYRFVVIVLLFSAASCSSPRLESFGVENKTDQTLDSVSVQIDGQYTFAPGIMAKHTDALHMTPTWPIPKKVSVTGSVLDGNSFSFQNIATGAASGFRGQMLIVLYEDGDEIKCKIKLSNGD